MRNSYYHGKPKRSESGSDLFKRRLLATEILGTLSDNGFVRCEKLETKYGDASEIVYAKPISKRSRYMIVVYTSCNQAGGAYVARSSGKDAIRVACLYIKKDGSTAGVGKNKRVNRVGESSEICKRMIERIAKTTLAIKQDEITKCNDCGAPMFTSKQGNLVCAEVCWSK